MRTKHIYVLIHIRIKDEVGAVKDVNSFTERSKTVLLLWISFVIYVSGLSLLYCVVSSLQPFDRLLEKGWPLGSLVCDVYLCFCDFPI